MLGILGAGLFGLHKVSLEFPSYWCRLCMWIVWRFTSIPAWACSGNEDALSGNCFLKLCSDKLWLTSSHLLRAPVCLTRAALHTLGRLLSTLRRFCWHLPPTWGDFLIGFPPFWLIRRVCSDLMSRRRGLAPFDTVAITTGEASWATRV